ncbi:LemA family protein [Frateuria sp.]|uniref:LemA family protein n=1 Tax=Frateuria sp. TaxID=2211372 RepID=UPI003F807309
MIFYATGLLLAVGAVWLFNRLVRLRNQVRNAWSDVDVQLQRRHDLVPGLVESVKGYADHERQLLERIAAERGDAMRGGTPAQRGAPEAALGQHLGRLLALGEAYPELKASRNFSQFSDELAEVEGNLQHARRFYNGSVREYNTALQTFPTLMIAAPLAFKPAEFFTADADARANVEVRFRDPA